jgi:hypothetical protein
MRGGFVLQSPSFTVVRDPVDHMHVWSPPRVFHTCGKSCGKCPETGFRQGFRAVFPRSGLKAKPGTLQEIALDSTRDRRRP